MIRGEVWWADVPTVGRRPVLVLTRDEVLPLLGRVCVALLTSNVRGLASETVLDEADGLPTRSAVSLDNVHTVPKSVLRARITQLGPARMEDVCRALRFATAC